MGFAVVIISKIPTVFGHFDDMTIQHFESSNWPEPLTSVIYGIAAIFNCTNKVLISETEMTQITQMTEVYYFA